MSPYDQEGQQTVSVLRPLAGPETGLSKSIPALEIERFIVEQMRCVGKDPALLQETIAQVYSREQACLDELDTERAGTE